jgi:hypothetical protein
MSSGPVPVTARLSPGNYKIANVQNGKSAVLLNDSNLGATVTVANLETDNLAGEKVCCSNACVGSCVDPILFSGSLNGLATTAVS